MTWMKKKPSCGREILFYRCSHLFFSCCFHSLNLNSLQSKRGSGKNKTHEGNQDSKTQSSNHKRKNTLGTYLRKIRILIWTILISGNLSSTKMITAFSCRLKKHTLDDNTWKKRVETGNNFVWNRMNFFRHIHSRDFVTPHTSKKNCFLFWSNLRNFRHINHHHIHTNTTQYLATMSSNQNFSNG